MNKINCLVFDDEPEIVSETIELHTINSKNKDIYQQLNFEYMNSQDFLEGEFIDVEKITSEKNRILDC